MFKKIGRGQTPSHFVIFYHHYLFEQIDQRCLQFESPFILGNSKVLVRKDQISRAIKTWQKSNTDPGRRI